MRTLTNALLTEQKKPTRKPVIKVEVQAYGHPASSGEGIQWELFGWQRFYSGAETKNNHGCCISGDGSLHRIRLEGTNVKYSRVANPGPASDYTSWSTAGGTLAGSHIAITANGANLMMVCSGAATLYYKESSDNGANWGAWVEMANARPCERGCAIAFKSNGDCLIVHASDINDPTSLYIQKRTAGTWSTGLGQRAGNWAIQGLTCYYDGDWNIIALVIEGSYLVAYRMVYGDGYKVTAGTWTTDAKIGLGRAKLDIASQLLTRAFRSQKMFSGQTSKTPTYWEKMQAVLEALAGEELDVSGVALCKPASYPPLLAMSRTNTPWIFRLKPGSDFIDYNWNKASTMEANASYGMQLCCDTTYLWATQANEVWRTTLPGSWTPPTIGSGAGDKITLATARLLKVVEDIQPEQESSLVVDLDNSGGVYNAPGAGSLLLLKRGARVNLHLGYKIPAAADSLSEAGRYFIESWAYGRDPNKATFTLNCIDAWGLLERYGFNKPIEWNVGANDFTVYDLLGKVMSAIGGTLGYKSRSSLMTTLYPRFDVHTGESGASVMRRLLNLVPDVIFFFGIDAYIVYPQSNDAEVYSYKFPTY